VSRNAIALAARAATTHLPNLDLSSYLIALG
jgi:hypothetical protein